MFSLICNFTGAGYFIKWFGYIIKTLLVTRYIFIAQFHIHKTNITRSLTICNDIREKSYQNHITEFVKISS